MSATLTISRTVYTSQIFSSIVFLIPPGSLLFVFVVVVFFKLALKFAALEPFSPITNYITHLIVQQFHIPDFFQKWR